MKAVYGKYIASKKNANVKQFYTNNGFHSPSALGDEKFFRLVPALDPLYPKWLKVENNIGGLLHEQ